MNMHDAPTASGDLDVAAGDRVELVATSDPYTRLRPGDRGTITDISHLPSDPPEPQVWVAWDNGATLAMLPRSGDQLHKLPRGHDADPA